MCIFIYIFNIHEIISGSVLFINSILSKASGLNLRYSNDSMLLKLNDLRIKLSTKHLMSERRPLKK